MDRFSHLSWENRVCIYKQEIFHKETHNYKNNMVTIADV